MRKICSKLTIKTPEWRQWRCFVVFFVNFEQVSSFFLVFPLLALSKKIPAEQYLIHIFLRCQKICDKSFIKIFRLSSEIFNIFEEFLNDFSKIGTSFLGILHLATKMWNKNDPANIYLFKVSNRNISERCEICSKLTIKTPECWQWRHSGVFIVNFEYISHLFLVFLLLTLNK